MRHKHQCIWDEADWGMKYSPQAQVSENTQVQAQDKGLPVDLPNAVESESLRDAPVVDIRGPANMDKGPFQAPDTDDDDIPR